MIRIHQYRHLLIIVFLLPLILLEGAGIFDYSNQLIDNAVEIELTETKDNVEENGGEFEMDKRVSDDSFRLVYKAADTPGIANRKVTLHPSQIVEIVLPPPEV